MPNTATKTGRTLQASTANGAGATTTGSSQDLTTSLGMLITGRITNGGTGPSNPCAFSVEVSDDGSNWYEFSRQSAGNGDGQTYEFVVELPVSVMYARVVFEGNDDQDVTVEAVGHELTSIG